MNVLIVDDERRHLVGMRRLVQRMRPDWDVRIASSGTEALVTLENWQVDILLSDIRMDFMDGLELLAIIRKTNVQMRIAVISAYDSFWYAKQAIQYGIDDYLLKPVDEQELEQLLLKLEGAEKMGNRPEAQIHPEDSADRKLLLKLTDYIEKHYGDNISLDIIANNLHFAPSYLSSMLKKKFGVGFSQYLREVRIKKAQTLLKESSLKVQDIAIKVGFKEAGYFIRVFRQECGMTPEEYRKR